MERESGKGEVRLEGKRALVTGGGRGIGKAIALALAREGADVVVASRTIHEIEGTANEIRALGRRALAVKADVSEPGEVHRMGERIAEEFGGVDILINNAGILGPIGPVWENDIGEWIRAVHINLVGTFLCCRTFLPFMMEQRWGRIVNLSGGGAAYPNPRFSAYASSKAAVVRFTETLAEEVKDFNITVNVIAPGLVNTRMQEEILKAGEKAGRKALEKAMKAKEEGVSPELAASLVVFLASEEGGKITGKFISAVWDDWRNIFPCLQEELFTLRRIDNTFFKPTGRKLFR